MAALEGKKKVNFWITNLSSCCGVSLRPGLRHFLASRQRPDRTEEPANGSSHCMKTFAGRKKKLEDLFRCRPVGTDWGKISNFLNYRTSWSFVDAHLASGPSVTLLLDTFILCSNFWFDSFFCPIVTSFCPLLKFHLWESRKYKWFCITKPFLWLFDKYQLIHFIETAKFKKTSCLGCF